MGCSLFSKFNSSKLNTQYPTVTTTHSKSSNWYPLSLGLNHAASVNAFGSGSYKHKLRNLCSKMSFNWCPNIDWLKKILIAMKLGCLKRLKKVWLKRLFCQRGLTKAISKAISTLKSCKTKISVRFCKHQRARMKSGCRRLTQWILSFKPRPFSK